MRDIELIDRVKQGQPKACYEFYYSYVDRVHRQLYAMVGPDADLDDLIQQTFIVVFKRIDSFRGESRFTTWLHRVVVNVAIDHLRARKRKVRPDLEQELRTLCAPSAFETPDEMLARSEKIALLHSILDGVKPKQRVVFMLYEVEGHTLEEIAELFGEHGGDEVTCCTSRSAPCSTASTKPR
jgi:RNA polymerase sigma-70 factor (ECF subfamily)